MSCQVENLKSLTSSRQSTVDKVTRTNQSTIDYRLDQLREKLNDPTLGKGFAVNIYRSLSEYEINNIAEYAVKKGNHPGKLFVRICLNAIRDKQ